MSTENLRKLHTFSLEALYSPNMRGAFVVRLGTETETARGHFEGRVEEVDTGKELKFRSTEELLSFIGQRYEEALRREQELNQRGE
jgi:hypothetical protein